MRDKENSTNIILGGASGRMGKAIIDVASASDDFKILSGFAKRSHLSINGINVHSIDEGISDAQWADVLLDFSAPDSLRTLLRCAEEHKLSMVLGSSGYTGDHLAMIENASESIPIFKADNFRFSMHAFLEAAEDIAKNWQGEISVEETHNEFKKGTPSGTAKLLAMRMGRAREANGVIGNPVAIKSVRTPGEAFISQHSVLFKGTDNVVKLDDLITSREPIAKDVLRVCAIMKKQKPNGIYTLDRFV